jgi:sterol desaturase/sphingolipid hydroxylase (fatty acid hydroxylase superfamily)
MLRNERLRLNTHTQKKRGCSAFNLLVSLWDHIYDTFLQKEMRKGKEIKQQKKKRSRSRSE